MRNINPSWQAKGVLNRELATIKGRKDHNRVRQYKGALQKFHTKGATCSQCKKPMRPDIAKIQLENKRENAPICFACIMGYERKIK